MGRKEKHLEVKWNLVYLSILLAVAVIIGAYKIATATVIAKSGVFYINQAKRLHSDPVSVIKQHPPGYPFMILMAHKLLSSISGNMSAYSWIYSGQIVSLLCRILAIIPIYFIGKEFCGARMSLWGLFILLLFPVPARLGSDALRDWPHMLFLATGFLLMLLAAKEKKWWLFGGVGLFSGLGYLVRPECIQLVIYAALWLLAGLVLKKWSINRIKSIAGLALLVTAFAISAGPYTILKQRVLPVKLTGFAEAFSITFSNPSQIQEAPKAPEASKASKTPETPEAPEASKTPEALKAPEAPTGPPTKREFHRGFTAGNITVAFWKIVNEFTEILKSFYMPALLIGIYYRFRKKYATNAESFFIPVFVIANVGLLTSLWCSYGYIENRHFLPLVVFTFFYIPVGLQLIAGFIDERFSNNFTKTKQRLWFFVLVIIGVAICVPRVLRPMHPHGKLYRIAAKWLTENTEPESLIIAPDPRISFYAERKNGNSLGKISSGNPVYIVKILNEEKNEFSLQEEIIQEEYSVVFYSHNGKSKIVVYEVK